MVNSPGSSLLTQEQINRLTDAAHLAAEADRREAQRKLENELRLAHYKQKWFKPFDLWSPGLQFLTCSIAHSLVVASSIIYSSTM